jgi:hypothetical protein
MKKIKSIQIKAAFLLIAFSLNTIIGFACAIGMNMDFNSHHQEEESAISESSHHHSTVSHHQDKVAKNQSKDEDNCCHDKVTKIAQVDKAVPQPFSISVNYLFLSALASTFYHIDTLNGVRASQFKYFVRSHHPPIPDIRIAIRSFQI